MSDAASLLADGAKRLAAAGIDSPRGEARVLLAHAAGVDQSQLIGSGPQISPDSAAAFAAFVARREKHEPVAYITGSREFWSLDFAVGPGVLIPRPDTETLIEAAMTDFPDRYASLAVLDIATGSACLPIVFLLGYPNGRAIATDSSPEALHWAERNRTAHTLESRVDFRHTNWTDGIAESFDVVFCNPPYIDRATLATLERDVRDYEPGAALDGGSDGLDAYRAIAPRISSHLKKTGRAYVEIGLGQAKDVSGIFATAGLETVRVVPDLSGISRCLVAAKTV